MSTAKQHRHPDPIPDTDEPRRSGCRPLDDSDEPENSLVPASAEPGALSGHDLLAAVADKKSPHWQALAARTRALTLSTPAERAAVGEALDEAVGDLLSVLGHVHYRTGRPSISGAPRLPHDDWPGLAPEQRAGWPDLQHHADRLREALVAAPPGGVLTERAEAVLALLDPIIAAGLALHENNSVPLPPPPATGYHRRPEQQLDDDEPGPMPPQKRDTAPTTALARAEVTSPSKDRHRGRKEDGLKLFGAHLQPTLINRFRQAARKRNIQVQELLIEAMEDAIARSGLPEPPPAQRLSNDMRRIEAFVRSARKTLKAVEPS